MFDMKNRKGITPVIAIVLLLMVTVGAVGVVYTQFQSLVGDPADEVGNQQQVQNTELSIRPYLNDDDDTINITVENTGDESFVLNETMRITYAPDGENSGFEYGSAGGIGNLVAAGGTTPLCHNDDTTMDPGDTVDCNTGIQYPEATSSVGIIIEFRGEEKSWSETCDPENSDSLTC
jgi:flagellin-like protein